MVSVSSNWQREDGVSCAVPYSPNTLNWNTFLYTGHWEMCASYVMGSIERMGKFYLMQKKASQKDRTGEELDLTAKWGLINQTLSFGFSWDISDQKLAAWKAIQVEH